MAKKVNKEAPAVEATAGAIATEVDEKVTKTPEVKTEEPVKDKLAEKAAGLFKLYPSAKTLYFTSDETAFFELHDAANHSVSLADKKVKPFNRTEV